MTQNEAGITKNEAEVTKLTIEFGHLRTSPGLINRLFLCRWVRNENK